MFYVDQFVYANRLRTYHPGEKFVFAISTMTICVLVHHAFIHFLVMGIMLGLLIFRARVPKFVVLKLMLVPLSFLLIGVVTIAVIFSFHRTGMVASVRLGGCYLGVTIESLRTAGLIMTQSLSSVCCLYFLALTTPVTDLIYVLQSLRLPSLFIELMMLIYRFIFVFIQTAFNIYTAQSSRWGYCTIKKSLHSFGILFANLWGKVFFKTQALLESMISRGYEGELRVLNPEYKMSLFRIIVFLGIDFSLVLIALMV